MKKRNFILLGAKGSSGDIASEGIIETNATNIPTNSSSGVPSGWTVIPIQN